MDEARKQKEACDSRVGDVRDGVGRAYAQVIDDASASSFRPFFDRYISKDAKVITDEWSGYLPLKKIIQNWSNALRIRAKGIHRFIFTS